MVMLEDCRKERDGREERKRERERRRGRQREEFSRSARARKEDIALSGGRKGKRSITHLGT